MIGAQYLHSILARTLNGLSATVPLSASVTARVNGRGTEGYRMGNEWQANVGAGYPLTRRVQLLAQLNLSLGLGYAFSQ